MMMHGLANFKLRHLDNKLLNNECLDWYIFWNCIWTDRCRSIC